MSVYVKKTKKEPGSVGKGFIICSDEPETEIIALKKTPPQL